MRAGLLNHTVTVLKPVTETNEVGEQVTTYITKFTTKARLQHSISSRDMENTEIFFNYTEIFTFRMYHNIEEFDRILYLGKQYRIFRITPEPESMALTVYCELINE